MCLLKQHGSPGVVFFNAAAVAVHQPEVIHGLCVVLEASDKTVEKLFAQRAQVVVTPFKITTNRLQNKTSDDVTWFADNEYRRAASLKLRGAPYPYSCSSAR